VGGGKKRECLYNERIENWQRNANKRRFETSDLSGMGDGIIWGQGDWVWQQRLQRKTEETAKIKFYTPEADGGVDLTIGGLRFIFARVGAEKRGKRKKCRGVTELNRNGIRHLWPCGSD